MSHDNWVAIHEHCGEPADPRCLCAYSRLYCIVHGAAGRPPVGVGGL